MIKQTRGALNFLIADYKGVLKNALIASSATFFALTANATDTTIDLTASTPQTDIIVNAGDTVTLNNGKTAFPEDAPYTASKISVADGGTLKITNGGNFKVDELTVKNTGFLPTGEYYADNLPHFVDNNPDRTTISVKNATFEGGTIYRPITIDNLVVTNNIDASNASLYGASGYKMRVTFEDNSTGNIRDLSVDELQLKKGTKVFIKNFSKMVGADGQFAVNSDFNSNISILAIKHDGDFFIGTYPDPGVDYENNSNGILGAVGTNSALVFGVTSEAEAEQVLKDANLLITDTDGKTKLNESQWKAVAYLTKPLTISKLVVDGNKTFDAKTFTTDTNNFPQTNWRALSLGENSAVFLSKDLTNSIAYSGEVSDTAAIAQITPAMYLGTAGRVYYHNSSAIILDSDTLRAGARYKIFNKDVALVNRDGRLDNSLEDSLTVKSRNGNFVTRVKVNSISKVTIDGLTIAPSTNTSSGGNSGSGTGTGTGTSGSGNTNAPTTPTQPTQPSNPSAGGNTSGVTEEVVEIATRNSYFNVSNALYNTFHEAHQFGTTGAGADFLSAVAGETTNGGIEAEQAARLGQLGAIYQTALTTSRMIDRTVANRTGVANTSGTLFTPDSKKGVSVWTTPVFNYTDADGLNSDGLGYGSSVKLSSLAVGADYLADNNVRAGGFFHVGTGKADGNGLANSTDGDVSFWGLGIYGSYTYDKFDISGDLSWTKIKDDVDSSLNMFAYHKLSADIDSTLVKASVNGQYRFTVSSVDLVPNAGLHYTNIKVDGYNVKADGLTVAKIGSSTANIFSIPVGLSVEKTFDMGNDWKLKPVANVSVSYNMGDTDTDFTSSFVGLAGDKLKAEIIDDFTYGAGAGLSLTKNNTASIDAGINYVGSQNTNSFDVFLKGSYQF